MTDKRDIQTHIIQAEIGADPAYQAAIPPLYTSSTYLWPSVSEKGPYDYGRSNNPNRDALARAFKLSLHHLA